MAGERFVDQAVVELAAYLRTNFPTKLRLIETQKGFSANEIQDPLEVLEADAPEDNRSPLVQVYAVAASPILSREKLWAVTCSVVITYVGDARPQNAEKRLNEYVTALIDMLDDDPVIGGNVTFAEIQDIFMAARGDDSESRKAALATIEVHTCET